MDKKLNILVSGGNRGIGLEICRQLGNAGHTVILGSRNPMKGEKAASDLGSNLLVRKLDVSSDSDARKLAENLSDELGYLDVLINNAGIISASAGVGDTVIADAREVMETNFLGAWNMIVNFLPLLKKSADPRIINISSGMGAWSDLTGGYAAYRLSKSSLNALTLLLSHELAGNVKVNAICPGWVRTDMGGPGASRSVEKGAETAVWLATSKQAPHGKFIRDKRVIDW